MQQACQEQPEAENAAAEDRPYCHARLVLLRSVVALQLFDKIDQPRSRAAAWRCCSHTGRGSRPDLYRDRAHC